MFRRLVIASAAAALAAAAAAAQTPAGPTWADPSGRISFVNAKKWAIDDLSRGPVAQFVGGTADEECRFLVIANPSSEGAKVSRIKQVYSEKLTDEQWLQAATGMTMFGSEAPKVIENGVDTSGGWPIRTAVFSSSNGPVNAALIGRPGFEARGFCASFDGKDRQAAFKAILASLASPKDAEYAAAEANEAVAAPPAPAAPEAPAAKPDEKKKKR